MPLLLAGISSSPFTPPVGRGLAPIGTAPGSVVHAMSSDDTARAAAGQYKTPKIVWDNLLWEMRCVDTIARAYM